MFIKKNYAYISMYIYIKLGLATPFKKYHVNWMGGLVGGSLPAIISNFTRRDERIGCAALSTLILSFSFTTPRLRDELISPSSSVTLSLLSLTRSSTLSSSGLPLFRMKIHYEGVRVKLLVISSRIVSLQGDKRTI